MIHTQLPEKMKRYIALIVFTIVAIYIYNNSYDVPFIFDDSDNIQNPSLRVNELSSDSLMKAAVESTLIKRPVANISFAINYYFGEYNVRGYHLVNIFIHIAAAYFLFLLLNITLKLRVNKEKYNKCFLISILAALLWLAHPLATQSVTYLVQRMNSMAAMFYVLCILSYVKGRLSWAEFTNCQQRFEGVLWFSASLISGIFAIGSKEIALTLPVVIFLYEWFFLQDLSRKWLKTKLPWVAGLLVFIYCAAYFYLGSNPIQMVFNSCDNRPFSSFERVLTECRVIVHYIGLLVYPNPERLVFDYNFPLSTSLFSPLTTFFSLLSLIAAFAIAVGIAKKERFVAFAIFWFLINLVLESSVICLEIIYEHRTYLPSMFLLAIFPAVLYRIGLNKNLVTGLLLMLIVCCGFWTLERNKIWQDPIRFWQDTIKKQPKARGYNNLGVALYEAEKLDEAGANFSRAINLLPDFPEAYSNMGLVQYKRNKFDEAEKYIKHALILRSDYIEGRLNLACLYKDQGKYDLALAQYRELYLQIPDYSILNREMGEVLLRLGQTEKSLFYLEKAYKKLPKDKFLLLNRGEAFMRGGKLEEAIESYMKVIAIEEENVAANYNLGLLLAATGKQEAAVFHYRKVALHQSVDVPVLYNLGNLYLRLGALESAKSIYEEFIKNSSFLADTYNNLGLVYVQQGVLEEAAISFQAALRVNPDNRTAADNLVRVRQDLKERESKVVD